MPQSAGLGLAEQSPKLRLWSEAHGSICVQVKGGILAYRETARLYNDSMSGMGEIAREAAEEVGAPEMPTANARRPLEPPPRAKSR